MLLADLFLAYLLLLFLLFRGLDVSFFGDLFVLVRVIVRDKELFVKRRSFVASLLRALRHLDGWRCHVFIRHLAEDVA